MEVYVNQGICHIRQRFQKRVEKLGVIYPPHRQDQVDADNYDLVPWYQWYDVRKHAHVLWINGAAVVHVCDVQF